MRAALHVGCVALLAASLAYAPAAARAEALGPLPGVYSGVLELRAGESDADCAARPYKLTAQAKRNADLKSSAVKFVALERLSEDGVRWQAVAVFEPVRNQSRFRRHPEMWTGPVISGDYRLSFDYYSDADSRMANASLRVRAADGRLDGRLALPVFSVDGGAPRNCVYGARLARRTG